MDLTTDPDLAATRATLYRFFSLAASDPRSERWSALTDRRLPDLAAAAALFVREEVPTGDDAPGELAAHHLDLDRLIAGLHEPRERRIAEYDEVFGLVIPKDCPPYETEYCPQTFSIYRSQMIGDIAGYYRAFGLEPSRDAPERQDHIALELEFMGWLIEKEIRATEAAQDEKTAICRDAQRTFFRDHLGWWTPAFAFALRKKVDGLHVETEIEAEAMSFQGAVGRGLAALIGAERVVLGIDPPTELRVPITGEADSMLDCGACSEGGM